MRVIVIGAGLGGLALTRRLRDAGFEVGVHERDRAVEARFQGYRIGLDAEGLAALRGRLPDRLLPLLEAVAGELRGPGRSVDTDLTLLGEFPERDEGLLFDRNVLRHLLLAGIEPVVTFGKRLERYDELDDGRVRVRFTDGTADTADVVVGADGMGSTVRRQLLPDVEVRSLGRHGAIGRTPLTERFARLVPGWSTIVNAPDLQLMLGKMPFRQPPDQAAARLDPPVRLPATPSYVRWVMLIPPERADCLPVDDLDPEQGMATLLELTADWHPELRELLRQADRRNSGIAPMRIGDPVPPWPTRAVTLLGDAAHPVPPGGSGATLAFLDAELLCRALTEVRDEGRPLSTALAEYEQWIRAHGAESREQVLRTFRTFDSMRDTRHDR